MATPRLLLFDVDGTLILSGGVAGRLMLKAVATVTGKNYSYNVRDFAGYTDRLIMRRLLQQAGVPPEAIPRKLQQAEALYLQWIAERFQKPDFVRVLPGVRELLEQLQQHNGYYLGLLTGNIRQGAAIKLASVGLLDYFPVGAFGDDAEDRNQLPPIALQRAQNHYGISFTPENTWIIGDAPNDVRCARANQVRVLAVATGVIPAEELAREQPDALIPDLSHVDQVLEILENTKPHP